MSNFKVGDTVQLMSGGPIMTVIALGEKSVRCHFFNTNNELQGGKEGVLFWEDTVVAVKAEGSKKPGLATPRNSSSGIF